MIVLKNQTLYKCEYCKKTYRLKRYAVTHEERCSRNPANDRKCLDCCGHLEKRDYEMFYDNPCGGESSYTVNIFYCKALELYLYPPICEHKKNAIDLGDDTSEPMKRECSLFKL